MVQTSANRTQKSTSWLVHMTRYCPMQYRVQARAFNFNFLRVEFYYGHFKPIHDE
jgi:hypothetical protein